METIRKTEIEMDTNEDVFFCPFNPGDKNTDFGIVVIGDPRNTQEEISTKEAAEKLHVPEIFLRELVGAFRYAMKNVQGDLQSIWQRMDEMEERIKRLSNN